MRRWFGAVMLATALVAAGCSGPAKTAKQTQHTTAKDRGKSKRAAKRSKTAHDKHEHPHGGHPHDGDAHHHHPHPHPHLDGTGGHHHPY